MNAVFSFARNAPQDTKQHCVNWFACTVSLQDKENLKMMMNLLRDRSPNIQYEAFHVFKVFVANPRKPPEVTKILVKNKAKLIAYLENFHNDRVSKLFVSCFRSLSPRFRSTE
ncbi:unnamed protein product [Discosporangium mesarthrocarpum]